MVSDQPRWWRATGGLLGLSPVLMAVALGTVFNTPGLFSAV
jgi:urea transporter